MITKTINILKGIQIKWTKIYILMHRIQMKLESFLNQNLQLTFGGSVGVGGLMHEVTTGVADALGDPLKGIYR